jgi:hypothetical protein
MARITAPRPVSPDLPRPLKGARGFSGNLESRETPKRGFSGISGEADERLFHLWRVVTGGRDPFLVWCVQGATADEMLTIWTGATVEAMR